MAERQLLFVLGMHRSGTSALCSVLENCGVDFGKNLLAGMEGVNEQGFWEDAAVVELNQEILQALGATWYTPPAVNAVAEWSGAARDQAVARIRELLEQGFGDGPLQAVKDPRLCVTLPLWLEAAASVGLSTAVCVIHRAPLEIAQSLHKRDGFALGYGLRLSVAYLRMLAAHLPEEALAVTYDELLTDSAAVMHRLAHVLPLQMAADAAIDGAIHADQRHFAGGDAGSQLSSVQAGMPDLDALEAEVVRDYPAHPTMAALVAEIVDRGARLTAIGEDHARALQTLQQRDLDVDRVGSLHSTALATIEERDVQIRDLDQRLQETGSHLGEALATLDQRDRELTELASNLDVKQEQLERLQQAISNLPVIGRLLQRKWRREFS